MHISFPAEAPRYCGLDPALSFSALVDGRRVLCVITAEALEDHFLAASSRESDLLDAFQRHREIIENAARRLLQEIGGRPVLLHSGYFRFYERGSRD
ncbi:DUF1488 domain-containing protein [Burkholderia gladioli]|uniref:DUF1488 domain-containing protein n=1 Tax=Burkholderia gladioli TaxID=28095 RepID=UPI0006273CCE|nr:DUF1488 domain-containing protein [Burkholderia gladioli]KAF1061897.1 hypothetical protein LvStA_00510 [Burkholderia gladioli]KKJ05199.1 hypothetical protein XF14_17910 [Burkholderia gladioli]MBA1363282.1 DUF1488 domain-containing protein [Burkholderia gladioli]MDN7498712.1 DUF1488 domain-containing protein [Burkholderia gladioli]MDN7603162.1 DUF1488 domain-containing protein [Burkholderia gladioli]